MTGCRGDSFELETKIWGHIETARAKAEGRPATTAVTAATEARRKQRAEQLLEESRRLREKAEELLRKAEELEREANQLRDE